MRDQLIDCYIRRQRTCVIELLDELLLMFVVFTCFDADFNFETFAKLIFKVLR